MKFMSENQFPPLTVETTLKILMIYVDKRKVYVKLLQNVLTLGVIFSNTNDRFYNIQIKNDQLVVKVCLTIKYHWELRILKIYWFKDKDLFVVLTELSIRLRDINKKRVLTL